MKKWQAVTLCILTPFVVITAFTMIGRFTAWIAGASPAQDVVEMFAGIGALVGMVATTFVISILLDFWSDLK